MLPSPNVVDYDKLRENLFSVSLVLQPGDTIVVPEKIDRETRYTAFMRGLKDWTQVIYQLGLGAAAIKVLR